MRLYLLSFIIYWILDIHAILCLKLEHLLISKKWPYFNFMILCMCFRCKYCDYKTADSSSLNRHMWRHRDTKPYSCRLCTFSCIQRTQMMAHYKNKHSLAPHDARKLIMLVTTVFIKSFGILQRSKSVHEYLFSSTLLHVCNQR